MLKRADRGAFVCRADESRTYQTGPVVTGFSFGVRRTQRISARIFAMAKQCDETLVTRDAPNTNHGRLACAFAVNEVIRRAIGKPLAASGAATKTKQISVTSSTVRLGSLTRSRQASIDFRLSS